MLSNECDDTCDIDSKKVCDNCGKCIGLDGADYKEVFIDGVVHDEFEADEYILDEETLSDDSLEYDDNVEFIEDIPEVKAECEENLKNIFSENHNDSHNCDCGSDHDHEGHHKH